MPSEDGRGVGSAKVRFCQCMSSARVAGLRQVFEFGLKLPATIATFRAGCILQGFLLEPMTKAFEENPQLPNLLSAFQPEVQSHMARYKRLVGRVAQETKVG